MGTGEFNAGGYPIQGGVEIILVASCYKKPEISAGLMGPSGSLTGTLPYFYLVFSAKVQLENKKGHTALDVAKAYADPRVVAIVQKRWDEIPPPVDKKKRK